MIVICVYYSFALIDARAVSSNLIIERQPRRRWRDRYILESGLEDADAGLGTQRNWGHRNLTSYKKQWPTVPRNELDRCIGYNTIYNAITMIGQALDEKLCCRGLTSATYR
jgi:hypothetical protein